MEKELLNMVESIDQIRNLMASVREKRKGYITNFYLDEFKHGIWVSKRVLYYDIIGDTVFFIHKNISFWNVFYVSTTTEELQSVLQQLTEQYGDISMIFDVVGRKKQCEELLPIFQRNGYFEESSLVRFIRINTIVEADERINKIQTATVEQAKQVHEMLYSFMDVRIEQIPYWEEYENWCKLGHILVYCEDNRIAGFFDYEKNTSTMIPRHWLVHPDFRGRNIGSVLYKRLMYEANDTKRILSWVIRTNTISIQSHFHYGFKEEDMFDYILTNKRGGGG